MTEVRETHVEKRRGRGGLFLVTFLVGALAIAVVTVMVMNVQGSLYWPAGHVSFNLRPTSTASTAAPTTTADATTTFTAASAPAAVEPTDTVTAPEPSAAPTDENPPASTAPADTQPQ